MRIRKNLGIMLILLGVILTMDQTAEFNGLVEKMKEMVLNYWPILLIILGMYLWGEPKKKK